MLLRLSGWLLLRLAERRLLGLLFHEPPRRTREDGAVQAPGRAGVIRTRAGVGDVRSPRSNLTESLVSRECPSKELHRKNYRPASGGSEVKVEFVATEVLMT